MSAELETGLSFLFETAYQYQPDFNRYVSHYVELLKLDNPFMDETQMGVAQQTLRVEFYRSCLQSLGLASFDALLILDYNGILLEINGMAEKNLGLKRKDVLGQPFFDKLFPETQKEEYLNWIKRNAKDNGEVFRKSTEVTMIKSSGTMFPAEIKVTEMKIFGSVLLVICFNDVTRRKWMDQALKYTEERYRKIMGENADAICLIDPYNKRIEESNPAFNVLLGYSDDELFALRLYDIMDSNKEDIDAWVEKRLRSGTSILMREQGRLFTRNHIPVDVEYSCSHFDLRDHPVLCLIIRDTAPREHIVKRTLADDQLEAIEKRMSKLGARLEEFSQTKLNKIQQEILAELNEHFEALSKEVVRDANKDTSPIPTRLENQSFNLKTLLFHVQSLFKDILDAKALPLNISVEPDVPDILIGDALKLQEILYHILENAIQHTDEGDLLVKVRQTKTEGSIGTLLFTIRDSGGGINPITKAKVTDVFSSDTPLETGEKFGIRGLTICAHLIKAFKGRIWFNTLEGKGSSFLFSLPLELTEQEAGDLPELNLERIRQHLMVVGGQIHDQRHDKPADTQAEDSSFTIIQDAAAKKEGARRDQSLPLRLLLVDQEVDNMINLQQALLGQSVEMRMVDNGRKAVELVQEQNFDLILIAGELPIMDGFVATMAIREWEKEQKRSAMLIAALLPKSEYDPQKLVDFNATFPASLSNETILEILNWARTELQMGDTETSSAPEVAVSADILDDESDPYEHLIPSLPVSEAEDLFDEPAGVSVGAISSDQSRIQVSLNEDMARLAPDFLNKRRGDIPKLKQGIADGKFDSIRVLGKSMKGTGGVYGFGQISEIGKELETAASEENLDLIGDLIIQLEDFLEQVEIVIDKA